MGSNPTCCTIEAESCRIARLGVGNPEPRRKRGVETLRDPRCATTPTRLRRTSQAGHFVLHLRYDV